MVCVRGPSSAHGKNLGEGINGQPEPLNLLGAAEPGAQLVQLEVGEMEMAEEAHVQGVRVLASTRQPGGNGRLPVAEYSLGGRGVQPFGKPPRGPRRPAGKGFSDDTRECRVEH